MSSPVDSVDCAPWSLFTCGEQGQLLSRSSIVLLSAVLVGMGVGNGLRGDVATLCGSAGLFGIAAFFSLHLVAHRRHSQKLNTVVERVNERLATTKIATEATAPARRSSDGSPVTGAAALSDHDSIGLLLDIERRQSKRRRAATRKRDRTARPT